MTNYPEILIHVGTSSPSSNFDVPRGRFWHYLSFNPSDGQFLVRTETTLDDEEPRGPGAQGRSESDQKLVPLTEFVGSNARRASAVGRAVSAMIGFANDNESEMRKWAKDNGITNSSNKYGLYRSDPPDTRDDY